MSGIFFNVIDFEQTYLHRRAVYRAVQKSQKSESQVAEQIGKIAVSGKQELLLLLSAWLLEMDGKTPLPDAERKEVETLTQITLQKWQQLQGVAAQIEQDLKAAEVEEKTALAAFQKQAPFGAGSKLFAAGDKRVQLQGLQDDAAIKQKRRETLTIALRQNVATRHSLSETFFRDCLGQIDKLASTQIFRTEVTAIISRMTYGAHTLKYPAHPQAQTSVFGQGAAKERDDWTPHPKGAKPKDVIDIPTTCNGMGEKLLACYAGSGRRTFLCAYDWQHMLPLNFSARLLLSL